MTWKDMAASLGTEAALGGLKAAKGQMGKQRYKRLIATAVAQLLELQPGIGRKKARRRAQRATGARPSKKLLRAAGKLGWKEGVQGAATALGAAGVAKIVGKVGSKVADKLTDGGDAAAEQGARPSTAIRRRPRR
jgi:hypothetical protein